MNFFIMVSLFLSAALGVFRGIDLALLTDAETGLCIVGSVWLRYGALAVAVGAAVAAGRCSQPQAGALRGHCTPSGVVALAAAVCYGEAAVLRILWMGSSVVMLIRAALEALCAFWMIGLGLSWLRKDWKIPTRSLKMCIRDRDFPVDVTRDFFHIAHDGFGVFEDVIVDALEDIGTVSYTHLDVYKRQVHGQQPEPVHGHHPGGRSAFRAWL